MCLLKETGGEGGGESGGGEGGGEGGGGGGRGHIRRLLLPVNMRVRAVEEAVPIGETS